MLPETTWPARKPTTGQPPILDHRLVIQSGKGGTGKTLVSAALATIAARQGKRVLLVAVDANDRFAPLFGAKSPVGYEPEQIRPGLYASNLDPDQVVVDFFKTHIRFRAIYRQILDSKVFQYFYAAGPGLRELICLGKIWRLLGETRRGQPVWDLVVLDAPATGHGLAILNIAQAAHDTLFGPMKTHAREIRDLLRTPGETVLNICAIPEEMPVNEACELHDEVRDKLGIPIGVAFLNQSMAPLLTDVEARAFAAATGDPPHARLAALAGGPAGVAVLQDALGTRTALAARTRAYAEQLRSRIEAPVVQVPYIFGAALDAPTLETVADELQASLLHATADRETEAP